MTTLVWALALCTMRRWDKGPLIFCWQVQTLCREKKRVRKGIIVKRARLKYEWRTGQETTSVSTLALHCHGFIRAFSSAPVFAMWGKCSYYMRSTWLTHLFFKLSSHAAATSRKFPRSAYDGLWLWRHQEKVHGNNWCALFMPWVDLSKIITTRKYGPNTTRKISYLCQDLLGLMRYRVVLS